MEGLKEEKELSGTRLFLNGLKSSLRNLVTERTTKVKENKSKITLTPHFLKEYGKNIYKNFFFKDINTFLEVLAIAPQKTETKIQNAVLVRNYTVLTLSYTNALRAFIVINITSTEVLSAKRGKEIKDAFI